MDKVIERLRERRKSPELRNETAQLDASLREPWVKQQLKTLMQAALLYTEGDWYKHEIVGIYNAAYQNVDPTEMLEQPDKGEDPNVNKQPAPPLSTSKTHH
jgi:hypothetical protein